MNRTGQWPRPTSHPAFRPPTQRKVISENLFLHPSIFIQLHGTHYLSSSPLLSFPLHVFLSLDPTAGVASFPSPFLSPLRLISPSWQPAAGGWRRGGAGGRRWEAGGRRRGGSGGRRRGGAGARPRRRRWVGGRRSARPQHRLRQIQFFFCKKFSTNFFEFL